LSDVGKLIVRYPTSDLGAPIEKEAFYSSAGKLKDLLEAWFGPRW
jgi:hypothetical protein